MNSIRIAITFIALLVDCFILTALVLAEAPSAPTTVTIQPSDAASLYAWACCAKHVDRDPYMYVNGEIQGIARFPTSPITGTVTQAVLTMRPYAEPLEDYSIDVYGIASGDGTATLDDAFTGEYLGIFSLTNSGFFTDATFDVTSFVSRSHVPFLGFNFRANMGADALYPPVLHVTFVPEPTALSLFVICLCGKYLLRHRKSVLHNRS